MHLASGLECIGRSRSIERSVPSRDSTPSLDHSAFDRIVRHLAALCPIDEQDDVYQYVRHRGLQTAFARDFALPPPSQQASLIGRLVQEHGIDALARTGLLRRVDAGREPMLDRFVWPRHRWCIPWVGPDAQVHSLSRAICAPHGSDIPRWVVPAGHPPLWPLGIDDVALSFEAAPADLVVVEGPADFIALRMRCLRRWLNSREPIPIVVALHSAPDIMPGWLHRYARGRRIIIATGRDALGEEFARKLTEVLGLVGSSSVERLLPPSQCKDWTSALEQEVTT